MHDLRDQVKRLSKGKSTHNKIGSRSIPHRLTKDENLRFEIALKKGYLTLKLSDRENLENIFKDYKKAEGVEPIILKESLEFPTEFSKIWNKVESINPEKYQSTRNYLNGAVTKLSPYLTRGVITLKQVWDFVLDNFPLIENDHQLLKELAWREYFLRVRENLGEKIFQNINQNVTNKFSNELPISILTSQTEINVLDREITNLIQTGYIHNHSRMWLASVVANIAQTDWKVGADWMYYYLLDGELSSNYLSWQWVAGTFGSKKYYANQENINRFSNTNQQNTFLDKSYEELPNLQIPEVLKVRSQIIFKNQVRQIVSQDYKKDIKTLLYSPWNLDPNWKNQDQEYQKILLLEPSHFDKFPVSANVLAFILKLAKQIKKIKIVVKDFEDLRIDSKLIYAKQHINTSHWKVENFEKQEYLFPEITGFYKSFFSFWKEASK